jgi:hypothetical protein
MDEPSSGGPPQPGDTAPPPAEPAPAPTTAPDAGAPPAPAAGAPPAPAAGYGAYPPGYGPQGWGPGGYGYPGYEGAAIHAPAYAAPPPQRSGAASALGILGIIFGVLIALQQASCIGITALVQAAQAPEARDPELMRLLQLDMGLKGVMAIMAVALIIVGVGVWRHRDSARKAMVIWSIIALVIVAGRTAIEAIIVVPQSAKHQRILLERQGQADDPQAVEMLKTTQRVSVGLVPLVWAPFPIVSLLLLTRRSVRDRCN